MRPAIYARKSTEQRVADEQRSVARQVADARAFAARIGLPSIDDSGLYIDDAVSGADVKNLRARARLIQDVETGRINVVIMADMSRFSRREGHEVVAELKRIAKRAEIYFYETGQRFAYGDMGSKVTAFVQAESNADYRRKIAVKTHAAMRAKAERGEVLGAVPFGYKRDGVNRRVYEPEAAVVRDIFERYARGEGFKKIANALNWKRVPTPRPRPGRKASWSVSNVRSILLQPLYRGIARWNRLKQHDEDGNPILELNPEGDHVTRFDAAWLIVPADISDAVDARFADENRKKFVAKPGARAKYLLSGGMLLCPDCGGRFEALNGKYYVCATRRHAGKAVCANPLALRIDVLDEAVLGFLDRRILHPQFIAQVVALAADAQRSEDTRTELTRQISEIAVRIQKLVDLAADTDADVKQVSAKINVLNAERKKIQQRLASMPLTPAREGLKAALEQRCEEWKKTLQQGYPEEARFVVSQLLGPIELWSGRAEDLDVYAGADADDRRGKENIEFSDLGFRAEVTPQGLLAGLGALSLVAGGGFEPPTFGL